MPSSFSGILGVHVLGWEVGSHQLQPEWTGRPLGGEAFGLRMNQEKKEP